MLWKCPLISFQESFWFSSLFNLIFPHNKTFYFQFQVFFFFLLHSFFFWLVVLLQAPVLSLSKLFLSPLSPSIPRFGVVAGTHILRRKFSSGAEKHPLLTLQPNRVSIEPFFFVSSPGPSRCMSWKAYVFDLELRMGLVGFRVLWRGTDPKVFFFGILSGNKKWVLCFLREKKTRWGWGLWCTELCAAIAEGGGVLVNLSHGMADLVSYRNADRDIDQVSYLFNLKVLFFDFNFDARFKFFGWILELFFLLLKVYFSPFWNVMIVIRCLWVRDRVIMCVCAFFFVGKLLGNLRDVRVYEWRHGEWIYVWRLFCYGGDELGWDFN